MINWLIGLYLFPLRLSRRLALYVKGRILQFELPFAVTLDVIRRRFASHRGIVLDIGAFDGDSATYLAKKLPGNRIIAFEPDPKSFNEAVNNCRGFRNIEVVNLGLSDQAGVVDFHVTNDRVSSSLLPLGERPEFSQTGTIKVGVTTLDEYMKEVTGEILLIKLDIQGAELKVLKKATATLNRTRLVLTEMLNESLYTGAGRYYEVDEVLRQAGFKLHSMMADYNYEGTKYFDVLYIRD